MVFAAGDEVHDVSMDREGRTVTYIQIDSDQRTTDGAYRLAVDWATEWDLPSGSLDSGIRPASRSGLGARRTSGPRS